METTIERQPKELDRPKTSNLEIVVGQLDGYKKQYRQSFTIMVALIFVSLSSLLFNVIQYAYPDKPIYFAQTTDGHLMPITDVRHQYITDYGVRQWVSKSLVRTFSMDYIHWQRDLMGIRYFYTQNGFSQLVKQMKESRMLDLLRGDKLLQFSVILGDDFPEIISYGFNEKTGRYEWSIRARLLIQYENTRGILHKQDLMADIKVVRVPVLQNINGICIDRLILNQSGGAA